VRNTQLVGGEGNRGDDSVGERRDKWEAEMSREGEREDDEKVLPFK